MVCVNVWLCCKYCAWSVNYENAVSSPRIDFFYLEKRGKTQIMGCFLIAVASPWQQEATAFVCVAAKTGILRRCVSQWHTTLITPEKWVKHCWVRHFERSVGRHRAQERCKENRLKQSVNNNQLLQELSKARNEPEKKKQPLLHPQEEEIEGTRL